MVDNLWCTSGHELFGHIVNYRYIEIQSCNLSFSHSPVRSYLTIAAQITVAGTSIQPDFCYDTYLHICFVS